MLQQTAAGREELRRFADAPLLMDGRQDRLTGERGANMVNQMRLETLSADAGKPIFALRAYPDEPDLEKEGEGRAKKAKKAKPLSMRPQEMDADDFRGIENEVMFCVGARVLLTQNVWVEAGLMNGALGVVRGYM